MDIRTLVEMRDAITELNARLSAVEAWIIPEAEVQASALAAPEPMTLPETVAPADDPRQAMAKVVEDHIVANIASWKWTRQHGFGEVVCPLTASDIAQRLNLDTDEVRMLIKNPELWWRVSWRKLPVPEGHPEFRRSSRLMHVMTRMNGAVNG